MVLHSELFYQLRVYINIQKVMNWCKVWKPKESLMEKQSKILQKFYFYKKKIRLINMIN